MRRAIAAVVATIVGLVLLLSYKTHPVKGLPSSLVSGGLPPALVIEPSTAAPTVTPTRSTKPGQHQPTDSPTASSDAATTATPTDASSSPDRPTAKPTHSKPTSHPHPTKSSTLRPHPIQSATSTPGTATGSVVQTLYGNVQVRISFASGRITGVTMLQVPDQDDMDRDINDRAIPILIQQTLANQSANVDVVSGATYTSTAYRQSLQAAIDSAGL